MFRTVSFRFLTNTHTGGSHLSYGEGFENEFWSELPNRVKRQPAMSKESIAFDGNKL